MVKASLIASPDIGAEFAGAVVRPVRRVDELRHHELVGAEIGETGFVVAIELPQKVNRIGDGQDHDTGNMEVLTRYGTQSQKEQ